MIVTKRLLIQRASENEIENIIEIEKHLENSEYITAGTSDEHREELNDPNYLLLMIKMKQTHTIIGYALINMNFISKMFEIRKIAVLEKGKGYGEESMRSLFKYAFEKLKMNKVWLDVYPNNTVGINLYEKLGMHRDGILRQNIFSETYGYRDQIIYSLLVNEYENKLTKDIIISWFDSISNRNYNIEIIYFRRSMAQADTFVQN